MPCSTKILWKLPGGNKERHEARENLQDQKMDILAHIVSKLQFDFASVEVELKAENQARKAAKKEVREANKQNAMVIQR